MRNKVEFKKFIIYSFFVIIIINFLFLGFNFYQYKIYTKTFNEKIDKIVSKLNKEYPKLEKVEIIEILNSNESSDNYIFREYGIDIENESLLLENDNYFKKFLILNSILIIIYTIFILLIFLKYNNKKDKELKKITKYIEELNNKNYKLDIDENSEDELSILKNEIYKITVMLKENAENSIKDKINLKNSLSDISHQLKTPLTSIIIMLDNILENPDMDSSTRNEFIKDIKRQIVNINFLVASLLKLSKLDACSINFINKDEYIKDILYESIKNVSALCDLKNVTINLNGNEKAKIYCDFKWQVEAITNILKNCVEHSNENSKININYEQNKMYSKIEIQDYGTGILEKDLPHIFERFYKGENSSSESIGIGLALSKSIIEKNNGYIIVDSKEKFGTKFVIKYFK